MNFPRCALLLLLSLACVPLRAPAATANWAKLIAQPDAWFAGPTGQRAISNVLSWQSALGSWPKNGDTTQARYEGDPAKLAGTFDNGATTGEVRFLARAGNATSDPRCRAAVLKALDHILAAQYPNGGWPQSFPPGKQYHRHITFNDGTMVRLLELLREVGHAPLFAAVDAPRRARAQAAFERGVECILKCQIIVQGQPTVWCAQHDETDLTPRPARSYELVSLSGAESAGVLLFLMSLENPSLAVVRAIDSGAAWFAAAKITGVRVSQVDGDRVVVNDPAAPPLWARFYEIGSNIPIFSGRDGVKKSSLAEIERERRNGYAWYGNWGEAVARRYAAWQQERAPR